MSIPKLDLHPNENIIWDAPIDSQIMNAINNKGRLIYGGLAAAMLILALYLLLLFANGFWGANENAGSARLIATIITGPAILVALVALWAFVERFKLIGAHSMPAHYFITDQRAISMRDNAEIFDEINMADISHTSIDGQGETQILMLARSADDADENDQTNAETQERKSPFLFVHLEDLEAVKKLVDQYIPNDQ